MEEHHEYLVLYNATTMMSEVETNTTIIFWIDYVIVEIICHIAGISNETLYMYIDYKQLLNFIPRISNDHENDPVKRGVNRKDAVVSFLLSKVFLDKADGHEKNIWKLSLRYVVPPQNPQEQQHQFYERKSRGGDKAGEETHTSEDSYLKKFLIQKPSTLRTLNLEQYTSSYQ